MKCSTKKYYLYTLSLALCLASSLLQASSEAKVKLIELAPPLDRADAEYSGMTWCADKLILMPQYSKRISADGKGYFYYLNKADILNYVKGHQLDPLVATPLAIDEDAVREAATLFDGFEAIACKHNQLWLSIETLKQDGSYQSVLMNGEVSFKDRQIRVNTNDTVSLSSQSNMVNIGDEALVMNGDNPIAFHEVNDARAVTEPKARMYNPITENLSELAFPHLPYRITDATRLDHDKRFWVINYKYSGDDFSRNAEDKIAENYGEGPSHKKYYNVERLIEFQLNESDITMVEQAPVQLEMNNVEGRNWEGIARLDNIGFLLITDKHPKTLFGFVPVEQ